MYVYLLSSTVGGDNAPKELVVAIKQEEEVEDCGPAAHIPFFQSLFHVCLAQVAWQIHHPDTMQGQTCTTIAIQMPPSATKINV